MPKPPPPLAAASLRSNSSTPSQPISTSGSGGLWSNSSGPENSIPPSSHGIMVGGGSSSFSYEELSVATDGFSSNNLLGQGGFGYVHKGILPNGKIVAVKSLKADSGQGDREFHAEVETISRVHHKHLVSLVGYCITGPHKLLVYEFLPNKTMEFHLHGNKQFVMDWPTRLKIAIGSAKGLAYLHEDCHPKIIHRDIKAANILLDFNFEAQVADFGLAKFTSDANTHVSTRVMGTFGYLAPEYANSGKLTEKSDVFSYGVMLLEFITGRRPVDYSSESQMEDSLVDWARPLLSKAVQDGNFDPLVDPRLVNNYDYEEMGRMVTCAASCVRHSAKRRPRMSQVVRALEGNLSLSDLNDGVKPGFSSIHSSSDMDSGADKEEMKKFRKLVYLSEDYGSSVMSRTRSEFSDAGMSSSSETRRQT
ncbi:Proline-rich receptor-like protein kinase PERK1 [Bienertia sinuspersici]